jgi:hypothetical protein
MALRMKPIDLERALDPARALRAAEIRQRLVRLAQQVRRLIVPRSTGAETRCRTLVRRMGLLFCSVALIATAVWPPPSPNSPPAVEIAMRPHKLSAAAAIAESSAAISTTTSDDDSSLAADRLRLAELGLDLARVESAEDLDALWHAIRNLVLTDLLTVPTQQRLLRRVWNIDSSINAAAWPNSEHH